MARKIYQATTIQSKVDDNEETIYSDIDTHPGTTVIDIATRTGLPQILIKEMTQIMIDQVIIIYRSRGTDEGHWTTKDWSDELMSNRVAARNWIGNSANDGKTIDDMATDLGINYFVAEGLATFMQTEMRCKIV